MSHSYGWQVDDDCWLGTQPSLWVSGHWFLSMRTSPQTLELPTNMVAGFQELESLKEQSEWRGILII